MNEPDYDEVYAVKQDLNDEIQRNYKKAAEFVPPEQKVIPYLGWSLGDMTHFSISWYDGKYWLDPKRKWPYPSYSIDWQDGSEVSFLEWLKSHLIKLEEQGGVLHEDRVAFQQKLYDLCQEHGPLTSYIYNNDERNKKIHQPKKPDILKE